MIKNKKTEVLITTIFLMISFVFACSLFTDKTADQFEEDDTDSKYNDIYHLNLRDTGPAGGLIFYINPNADKDGWKYLEAAPGDQSGSRRWIEGGSTQTTLNGNTSSAIGTGLANSNAIISQSGHSDSPAKLCLDLSSGTYSDWFLPSRDELSKMWLNLKHQGVGDFADADYWSSTEFNSSIAYCLDFLGSTLGPSNKSNFHRVRAARAF